MLAETHQPRPVQSPATFTPLSLSEIPEKGDVVGIDAEFVTLNQEEAEVKSDGTHTTLKPSQLSVARITVTRGWVVTIILITSYICWNSAVPRTVPSFLETIK